VGFSKLVSMRVFMVVIVLMQVKCRMRTQAWEAWHSDRCGEIEINSLADSARIGLAAFVGAHES